MGLQTISYTMCLYVCTYVCDNAFVYQIVPAAVVIYFTQPKSKPKKLFVWPPYRILYSTKKSF
jgi:hypothetical protein